MRKKNMRTLIRILCAVMVLCGAMNSTQADLPMLLWQHHDGSIAAWSIGLERTGGGLFSPSTASDSDWRIVSSGDFNGDSKRDLVWQHTDGSIAAWFMDDLNLSGGSFTIHPRRVIRIGESLEAAISMEIPNRIWCGSTAMVRLRSGSWMD